MELRMKGDSASITGFDHSAVNESEQMPVGLYQ